MKLGVLTSGGDAQGMNACIRSVVRSCWHHEIIPYGIYSGYEGLIENEIEVLSPRSVGNIIQKGGTILKCARSMGFRTSEGRKKAYENYKKHNLDGLVVIGGDGSITGANIFSKEFNVPVIGIPATIDNDISGTERTIGFDTAANVAVDAIDKIRDTADSHNRIFFIEVMGKEAGYLALQVGLSAGAEIILIPEVVTTKDEILKELQKSTKTDKVSHIVVVAEGNQTGNVYELSEYISDRIENYDCKVAVLGHIQRGGSPSNFDRVLASEFGLEAVRNLLKGNSNLIVGVRQNKVITYPIEEVMQPKKEVNNALIDLKNVLTKV